MACQFYCPRHYGLTMNAFNDFVQQHSFVDVKLVCRNKRTVYSHKLILASASPFLKAVIEERDKFDDMVTVYLPDFDHYIVNVLLTFLYEGVMKITLEELEEFRELCIVLSMVFPGADVVRVLSDNNDTHSLDAQRTADETAQPFDDAERGLLVEKASLVSSRETLQTPAKVPDTLNTNSAVSSLIPKIEDCEECQSFQSTQSVLGKEDCKECQSCLSTQSVLGNDFQNTRQMLDVRNSQQDVTGSGSTQPENHRQKSLEAGGSNMYSETTGNSGCRGKVMCSRTDAYADLNLLNTTSRSALKILQNNETTHIHSTPVTPVSVEQHNFQSSNTHFAPQKSTTQQMIKEPKAATMNSSLGVDMNSISSVSAKQVHLHHSNANSAGQSSMDQKMKKQSKTVTKKILNAAGVQEDHLTQILKSSLVHKKLPEPKSAISQKRKQSQHLKIRSKPSYSKEHDKSKSVQKSPQPKKRKKVKEL